MMKVAVDFYKGLFAREEMGEIRLADNFWEASRKVSIEENDSLTAPFSETEIREAVFSCYPEGAPGQMGSPFSFIKNFGTLSKLI
jgi:hypothetical protein